MLLLTEHRHEIMEVKRLVKAFTKAYPQTIVFADLSKVEARVYSHLAGQEKGRICRPDMRNMGEEPLPKFPQLVFIMEKADKENRKTDFTFTIVKQRFNLKGTQTGRFKMSELENVIDLESTDT